MNWTVITLRGPLPATERKDPNRAVAMTRANATMDLHGFSARARGLKVDEAARTITVDASHYYTKHDSRGCATCQGTAP